MKAVKDALIEINVTKANTKIVRFLFLKLWQDKKLKLVGFVAGALSRMNYKRKIVLNNMIDKNQNIG